MKNKEKAYGILAGGLGGAITVAGELMQFATQADLLDYNWTTGHLSDFGIVPAVMGHAMAYSTKIKNKFVRNILPFAWPAICTIHEYFPIKGGGEDVYDPQDIALYWAGAAVTYAGVKLASSENRKAVKNTLNKINPFKKKEDSSLESIVID
ncbi:hypothetical protein ACFLTH_13635 [Bacteroidota bacterium]